MRKPAATVFIFVALSATAAADGPWGWPAPGPMSPPGVYQYPPIIRLYTWNGLYIGGHGGGGWNNSFASETNGFLGGAQIGFNVRTGRAVLGLEAQWTGSGDTGQDDSAFFTFPGGLTGTFQSDIDWMATLTARAGVAWDRSLLYVKGGPAWARNSFHGSIAGLEFDGGETRSGWAVGGGYEYAFRNAWSARIEYLFMDFGSETISLSGPAGTVAIPGVDQQVHAVTLSINYRFDWPTTSPLGPD